MGREKQTIEVPLSTKRADDCGTWRGIAGVGLGSARWGARWPGRVLARSRQQSGPVRFDGRGVVTAAGAGAGSASGQGAWGWGRGGSLLDRLPSVCVGERRKEERGERREKRE
jgi:hypothetical protein